MRVMLFYRSAFVCVIRLHMTQVDLDMSLSGRLIMTLVDPIVSCVSNDTSGTACVIRRHGTYDTFVSSRVISTVQHASIHMCHFVVRPAMTRVDLDVSLRNT